MEIKTFKLKKGTNINDLLKEGFKYSVDCKYLTKIIQLKGDIVLWLEVYLKDFSLNIEVLDDVFGQYYMPFYEYKDNKSTSFKYLDKIIEKYNYEMNNISIFESDCEV